MGRSPCFFTSFKGKLHKDRSPDPSALASPHPSTEARRPVEAGSAEWTWGWMKRLPPASLSPGIAMSCYSGDSMLQKYRVKNAYRLHWQGREEPGADTFASLVFQ
ncbi:uncharacterized protein FAM167A-AS1 [Gorilla gorilla gorilla]|uniref:uncharacterized protein FAM167A-AS1 n=1 Tax=Gorilla gorilla gorilla TaxID=9595 RepID=UPI00300A2D80